MSVIPSNDRSNGPRGGFIGFLRRHAKLPALSITALTATVVVALTSNGESEDNAAIRDISNVKLVDQVCPLGPPSAPLVATQDYIPCEPAPTDGSTPPGYKGDVGIPGLRSHQDFWHARIIYSRQKTAGISAALNAAENNGTMDGFSAEIDRIDLGCTGAGLVVANPYAIAGCQGIKGVSSLAMNDFKSAAKEAVSKNECLRVSWFSPRISLGDDEWPIPSFDATNSPEYCANGL
jgi:hypothetical protein